VDATTVVGNGKLNLINHTNASSAEFFRVRTQ
jgi:hypothetical protein